ncbi:MAG TPA: choice-of-anchor D domain-containing protein [Kofleriaceae bacterium]|nr:choice-of-anchor D domain-containing protein [Kofleriaceae bacterium]
MRRRRRALRRVISVACVLGVAALAYAATGTDSQAIDPAPSILVVSHQNGTGGSGAVILTNNGTTAFDIGSVSYACDSAMQLQGGSGGTPFTLAAGASKPLVVACPPSLPLGMQRCTFSVNDSTGQPITSFLGVCQTQGMVGMTASPSSIDFGDVAVGTTSPTTKVTLTAGNLTSIDLLQLQVDSDSFEIAAPCATNTTGCDATVAVLPGGSTTVDVACRPKAAGPVTGRLFAISGGNGFFLGSPVMLSCNGGAATAPVLDVFPTAIDFGRVEVQGGSAQTSLALRNIGGGTLTIDNIQIDDRSVPGARADWSSVVGGQCTTVPCPLAGGQELDVIVNFDPSQLDARPASMLVQYTTAIGASQNVTVPLDGIGQGATLERVGTGTLNFGIVPLDTTSSPLSLRLHNAGNRPTTATLVSAGEPTFAFPVAVTVDPGVDTTVPITCRSSTEGVFGATLTVSAPDVVTPAVDVALACEVRNTQLAAKPGALDIPGEIVSNGMVRHELIVIERVGTGPAIPLNPPVLMNGTPNLTLSLSQTMTTATIDVGIDTSMPGPFADTIVVSSPQTGITPITIPVSGTIVTASFTTPNVVSLGTFCVGQPTTSSLVAMTSTGTARLDLLAPPILQGDPSPFDVAPAIPSTYPATVAAGGSASVTLTPKRGTAAGDVTDVLVWTTEQAGRQQTTVTASFVDNGGALAPSMLSFGEVPIRVVVPNAMQVTLQNCDLAPLTLEPLDVPEPFALDSEFPTALAPGEKAVFSIAFRPTTVGHFEQTMTVRSTAGDTYPVLLVGDGITNGSGGEGDGGLVDETSFYACGGCASHDPSGVLAIAVAVVCAAGARRRRR